MPAFRNLYRVTSFRDSFESLAMLEPAERRTVVEAVEAMADQLDSAPVADDSLVGPISALRTVRLIVADEGYDAVLAEIKAAMSPKSFTKLAPILDHLHPTPYESEFSHIREIESSALPILTNADFYLDFRVSRRKDTDPVTLVPLFIARLEFDEPVGGSDSANFQLSASALRAIRDEIDSALSLLSASTNTITKDHLPAVFRTETPSASED